ncbi:metal-dependent hydrolase [Halorussus halophilus]|uniref:metal-dependent hydrolase n=1 Tax=Halorussus halophilus TaxID=2650975 RepID=UPI0013014BB2|nr:metal-dependent hydrolase [Halorussus halophilus]
MVDVAGHFAMALLFVLPAWYLADDTGTASRFVGLAMVTAMLPDSDLFLGQLLFLNINHHGITHSLTFVVPASIVFGAIATGLVVWYPRRTTPRAVKSVEPLSAFKFTTAAFLVGGVSHLFADILSAPDIAPPIKPLMPFSYATLGIDVVYYDGVFVNFGLLVVALVAHGLAYRSAKAE